MLASRPVLALVLVGFLVLASQGANAQALKKLFGVAGKNDAADDALQAEDYANEKSDTEVASEERDEHYTTTPRPGFFQQFSFPTLPPFTFPPFPTLPPFPSIPPLPALPQLPNLATILPPPRPRPTIVATKTLFVEVTRRVTRMPVCMTVQGVRPPCQPDNGGYRSNDNIWQEEEVEEGRYYIKPTAALEFPTAGATVAYDDAERQGRYLELKTAADRVDELKAAAAAKDSSLELQSSVVEPNKLAVLAVAAPAVVAAPVLGVVGAGGHIDGGSYYDQGVIRPGNGGSFNGGGGVGVGVNVGLPGVGVNVGLPGGGGVGVNAGLAGLGVSLGLNQGVPVTAVVTRTLFVTRVQTVTDFRSTATLIAQDCIPSGVNIPFCYGPPPPGRQRYTEPAYPTTRRTTTRKSTPRPTPFYITARPTYIPSSSSVPPIPYPGQPQPPVYNQPPPPVYSQPPTPKPPAYTQPPVYTQPPTPVVPAYVAAPYKAADIGEQVDAQQNIDAVLEDNFAKA